MTISNHRFDIVSFSDATALFISLFIKLYTLCVIHDDSWTVRRGYSWKIIRRSRLRTIGVLWYFDLTARHRDKLRIVHSVVTNYEPRIDAQCVTGLGEVCSCVELCFFVPRHNRRRICVFIKKIRHGPVTRLWREPRAGLPRRKLATPDNVYRVKDVYAYTIRRQRFVFGADRGLIDKIGLSSRWLRFDIVTVKARVEPNDNIVVIIVILISCFFFRVEIPTFIDEWRTEKRNLVSIAFLYVCA